MKKFSIEHIGIIVTHPIEMAAWYKNVLGFEIRFSNQQDNSAGAFLVDGDSKVMLEFGKLPNVEPLKSHTNHYMQFHIAVKSNDPDTDMDYLIGHGAKFIEKCPVSASRPDDYLIVLEDPWGHCIQLAKRGKAL